MQLTQIRKARKILQQPCRDILNRTGQEANSRGHEQHANNLLNCPEVVTKPLDNTHKGLKGECRQQERHAEPSRIESEQQNTLADCVLRSGNRKDRSENWADARRPAEAKSQPHNIGAPKTWGPLHID